ncbi:MAG: peptidoglycan editing factor PgeF, partial [Armatimonadetes bacterium]|nr:peptidoglycan editing factor PgeF [Armatimonadota bacterium]
SGGMSAPPFDSLNLGLHVGDDAEAVWRNRRLFCAAVGVDADSLVVGQQAHGTGIAVVTKQHLRRGSRAWDDGLPGTDALITDRPSVPLLTLVADCCVCSLYDPVRRVVAVAHAGWRGLLGGILPRTVTAMSESFGCHPSDVRVGIGPCIGPCCYEVGHEVAAEFEKEFPGERSTFLRKEEPASMHLDLTAVAQRQLRQEGVLDEHTEVSGICTSCNTDSFYSYRAEAGVTGRFGGLIMLRA